jgi:hypothetical protein
MRPRPRRLDPNTVVLLKHIGIGVIVISAVALIVTGVWYGTRLSVFTISNITASGGETIAKEIVAEKVNSTLEGTYLGLVPRRFSLLYPKQEVLEALQTIERIKDVVITKTDNTTLTVTYGEYLPHGLWCQSAPIERCVFLDEHGFAFGQAPTLTGGSFLRVLTIGREVAVGKPVMDESTYLAVQELVDLLAARQWYVAQVEIDHVEDVFFQLVGGGELKIRLEDSPQQIVDNLFVVLTAEEFTHLSPGNFQYIDLRFGEKVFVNEETPQLETGNANTSTTTAGTLE